MRLYFESGPKDAYGQGWFQFFLAEPEGKAPIVFRMPIEATKPERIERARSKLFFRYHERQPFKVTEADEVHVVRWLMEHRKKAELGEYGQRQA